MIVRPLRRKDLPAVSRLAAQLIRQHHNLDGERFFEVEDPEEGYRWFFSKEMEREKAIILVAEEGGRKADGRAGDEAGGGKIVGYVYATLEARNWNDLLDACGKINDILVDPTARRAGAGRALMTAMLSELRGRGVPRVVLMTAWRNPDAHLFFESLGFRRTMLEMTREMEPVEAEGAAGRATGARARKAEKGRQRSR